MPVSPPACRDDVAVDAVATTCAAAGRTLRATGASAATLDEKVRLAFALVDADKQQCIFPDRHRFVLEWLCGVLRGAKGAVLPRVDVRFWRLLDALLHRAAGGLEALADDACPVRLRARLPPALRARVSQSSRLLLQCAAAAFQSGGDGAEAEAEAEASAEEQAAATTQGGLCLLYGRVRLVMRVLLVEQSDWFQPGPEATVEYAAKLCIRAAMMADQWTTRGRRGGRADGRACEVCLEAAGDAVRAVGALQVQPRKLLALLSTELLRPILTLMAACTPLVNPPAAATAAAATAAAVVVVTAVTAATALAETLTEIKAASSAHNCARLPAGCVHRC